MQAYTTATAIIILSSRTVPVVQEPVEPAALGKKKVEVTLKNIVRELKLEDITRLAYSTFLLLITV